MPEDPTDIRDFLLLYSSDGKENINEVKYANFIDGLLYKTKEAVTNNLAKRKITASVLMTKYALKPFELANNHVSIIKGWVILQAYILGYAEQNNLPKKIWEPTCNLCWHEITEHLENLKNESIDRNNRFFEGSIQGDGGFIYQARVTIVLGWLAAYELIQKINKPSYILDERLVNLIKQNYPERMWFWGESATIYYIMIVLFLKSYGGKTLSITILENILSDIANKNTLNSKVGLADPYYSIEQILKVTFRHPLAESIDFMSFTGTSYTLKPLIDCLVRENQRAILEALWYPISQIQYCEYFPKPIWHTYLWQSLHGNYVDKAFDAPQSWNLLVKEAFRKPQIPKLILYNRCYIYFFLLTYPHRVKSDLIKLIDPTFSI